MPTVILKYDARNPLAKKTLDYVLSLGVFENQTPFVEADEDIKNGRVYSAKNGKDLIRKCLKSQ